MRPTTARTARDRFEDSEALRALLNRLHDAGRDAWRTDPEAAALMRHAAQSAAEQPRTGALRAARCSRR